jgi:hypothetical protein
MAITTFFRKEHDLGDDEPCPTTAELTFQIKNYGKTPAILKFVFAGFGIAPIGSQIGVVIQQSILGAGETTETLNAELQRGLTRNEAKHVFAYTKHMVFTGQIAFDDVWGNGYITEFHFTWEHSTNRMQLSWIGTEQTAKDS